MAADLAGLDEGERLEQLVERPEPAGQDDEGVRVLHEHRLAGEEVAELDAEVDVGVERLLVRQLDIAPDREAATLLAAAVGRLHRARTTTGDDREAVLGEGSCDPARELVVRMAGRCPGGAEDRDGGADGRERVEALHELREDPQGTPRVGVEELGAVRLLQEALVLGGAAGRMDQVRLLGPDDHPAAPAPALLGLRGGLGVPPRGVLRRGVLRRRVLRRGVLR